MDRTWHEESGRVRLHASAKFAEPVKFTIYITSILAPADEENAIIVGKYENEPADEIKQYLQGLIMSLQDMQKSVDNIVAEHKEVIRRA
jgi:hypothetical protein